MVGRSRSLEEGIVVPRVISLLGSGGGHTPSSLQAGIQLDLFGREVAPASLSVHPEQNGDFPIASTSGQLGTSLSKSAVLQLSLESRLRVHLGVNGSLESELTWKSWDMPLGLPICALRASTRRTVDSGFTGWPTPDISFAMKPANFEEQLQALLERRERTKEAVRSGETKPGSGRSLTLQMAAKSVLELTSWTTPCVLEPTTRTMRPSREATGRKTEYLGRQVYQVSGVSSTSQSVVGSTVPSSTGALDPGFCRWLMGYPKEWDVYVGTGTR